MVIIVNSPLLDVSRPRTRSRFQTEVLATKALQIRKITVNNKSDVNI